MKDIVGGRRRDTNDREHRYYTRTYVCLYQQPATWIFNISGACMAQL